MALNVHPKKDVGQFEAMIRDICDLAFNHGAKTVGVPQQDRDGHERKAKFIAACHEGYALAQRKIVEELTAMEGETRDINSELKTARVQHRIRDAEALMYLLRLLTYRGFVLRRVADALGWVLLNGERWSINRHYMGGEPGYLTNSNISSCVEAVDEINKDPMRFGLICDITTCFQICDVIEIAFLEDPWHIQTTLMEVKEGSMNRKIVDMLESYGSTQCERALHLFRETEGTEAFRQLSRVARQYLRVSETMKIAETGRGQDPRTGLEMLIPDKYYFEEGYWGVVRDMIDVCEEKGSSMTCVDDCLFLGIFDTGRFTFPRAEFQHAVYHLMNPSEPCLLEADVARMKEETDRMSGIKDWTMDLRQAFYVPPSMPPYLWPIGLDVLMDVIFGRKMVFTYLDFDRMFKVASSMGLKARWTKKHPPGPADRFTRVGRRPVFEKGERRIIMGDLSLIKIQLDGIRPDSFLRNCTECLSDTMEPSQ